MLCCCGHHALLEVLSKSYAVGNTQQVAFIYFKGFAFKRGALGNPACLVTSLGLLLLPPRCKRTQHPALPPGGIRAEKLGSDPSFSHMGKKKKKERVQGVNAKPAIPGDCPQAAAQPGWGVMGLGAGGLSGK